MSTENRPIKVLLCSVPFGCANLGDEAILEGVVHLLREINPSLHITASTEEIPPTAKRLGVDVVRLIGFGCEPVQGDLARRVVAEHDVIIWSGATGLSDYPEEALDLLALAQSMGKTTLLFGVGMNAVLNPYLYKLLPGTRRRVFDLLRTLTFGALDLSTKVEVAWQARAKRRMNQILPKTLLIVLRSPSAARNLKSWCDTLNPMVGADPALLIPPSPWDTVPLTPSERAVLDADQTRIAITISAQSPVKELAALAQCLGQVAARHNARIIGLPINIQNDGPLMEEFRKQLPEPDRMILTNQIDEPGHVVAIAARCHAIVSSRLHGLILAAAADTPLVGISRGTKINNFLLEYDQPAAGTVESPDVALIESQLNKALEGGEAWRQRHTEIRHKMLARLTAARDALAQILQESK